MVISRAFSPRDAIWPVFVLFFLLVGFFFNFFKDTEKMYLVFFFWLAIINDFCALLFRFPTKCFLRRETNVIFITIPIDIHTQSRVVGFIHSYFHEKS